MNKLEERLTAMETEIAELKKWKANCNIAMAWWGGVLMAVMTAGGAIVHYYDDLKSYLIALWGVK